MVCAYAPLSLQSYRAAGELLTFKSETGERIDRKFIKLYNRKQQNVYSCNYTLTVEVWVKPSALTDDPQDLSEDTTTKSQSAEYCCQQGHMYRDGQHRHTELLSWRDFYYHLYNN